MAAKIDPLKVALIALALWLVAVVIFRFNPVVAVVIMMVYAMCGAFFISLVAEIIANKRNEDDEE